MGKRILLFVATNFAIIVTLSIIMTLLGIGGYVGPAGLNYQALMVFCLFWGMGGALISLQMSRWVAKRFTGVRLVDGRTGQQELDWLYETVARLTKKADLPMPEVGIYEAAEVNAFATGPSKRRSLVAVSSGLLRSMRPEEIEGVLAHEVAHIANGDMVTMTLIQGVVNAFVIFLAKIAAFAIRQRMGSRGSYMVSFAVEMALYVILGYLGAIITAWFSRQREFRADHGGAILAGRDRMIAALKRLSGTQELIDTRQEALATLKISDKRSWLALFSTHPPLERRIAVLERTSL
jgi:heat shock protein HtpX